MTTTHVGQLSDEELSRWIASKIEPEATLPWDCGGYSTLRVWRRNKRMMEHKFEWHWTPRDMVSDPAMTVLLLEKLLKKGANICGSGAAVIGAEWPDVVVEYGATTEQSVTSSRLGRAICEAFALANNYPATS